LGAPRGGYIFGGGVPLCGNPQRGVFFWKETFLRGREEVVVFPPQKSSPRGPRRPFFFGGAAHILSPPPHICEKIAGDFLPAAPRFFFFFFEWAPPPRPVLYILGKYPPRRTPHDAPPPGWLVWFCLAPPLGGGLFSPGGFFLFRGAFLQPRVNVFRTSPQGEGCPFWGIFVFSPGLFWGLSWGTRALFGI